ncbi:MAG: glycosyltransferase [Gammaproteobacteria bacterium]|nr:glycosyltransferase [Gammaproteobacteria bacterium]MDH5692544.1 glycosyltransferase [Gammaproteobacteria bacterium]
MKSTQSEVNYKSKPGVTAAIVTYRREKILLDTIEYLLNQIPAADEILVVDQTEHHQEATIKSLTTWSQQRKIRLLALEHPSITGAMNNALVHARHELVVFVDDDVKPEPNFFRAHINAHKKTGATLVAGRVIQPWQEGKDFRDDEHFHMACTRAQWAKEFIGCNFSVNRQMALELGGFDECFVHVAYRYEAEFANRMFAAGQKIYFEPAACLHHLKVKSGGTRSFGEHLKTVKPSHSVGEYYYLLRAKNEPDRLKRFFITPLRSVITKHHLKHPWWIPLMLLSQILGMLWSVWLYVTGPKYVKLG